MSEDDKRGGTGGVTFGIHVQKPPIPSSYTHNVTADKYSTSPALNPQAPLSESTTKRLKEKIVRIREHQQQRSANSKTSNTLNLNKQSDALTKKGNRTQSVSSSKSSSTRRRRRHSAGGMMIRVGPHTPSNYYNNNNNNNNYNNDDPHSSLSSKLASSRYDVENRSSESDDLKIDEWSWRQPSVLALVGFLFVLAVATSTLLYFIMHNSETHSTNTTMSLLCNARANAFQGYLNFSVGAMSSIAGLLSLQTSSIAPRAVISQSDFQKFLNFSGLQTQWLDLVLVNQYVRNASRAAWEAAYNKPIQRIVKCGRLSHNNTVCDFVITAPQVSASEYYPILWYYPNLYNGTLIGVDTNVDPYDSGITHRTVHKADLLFSPPQPLSTPDISPQFGIVVGLPVYDDYGNLNPPQIDNGTTDHLIGVVLVSLRTKTVLQDSQLSAQAGDMAVELYDRTNRSLSDSQAFVTNSTPISVQRSPYESGRASTYFTYGYRDYEFRCVPSTSYFNSFYTIAPIIVAVCAACLIFILLLLILFSCLYMSMLRSRQRAALLHEANRHKSISLQLLDQARLVADAANQSKTDFLAFLCHELRNPLHVIVAMLDFFRESFPRDDSPESHEAWECIDSVDSQVKLMNTIVNDALDLSKIEAGKIQFEVVPFSLSSVARGVVNGFRARANAKNLVLDLRFDPTIPLVLYSDPTRLRQVLLNLCSNSLKFTEKGSVTIAIRRSGSISSDPKKVPPSPLPHSSSNYSTPRNDAFVVPPVPSSSSTSSSSPAHTYKSESSVILPSSDSFIPLEIIVTDTGSGIEASALPHLFKPYSQAKLSVTRTHGGTGLGLCIIRQIIGLLGGTISVQSTVGVGTTFKIDVPLPTVPPQATTSLDPNVSNSDFVYEQNMDAAANAAAVDADLERQEFAHHQRILTFDSHGYDRDTTTGVVHTMSDIIEEKLEPSETPYTIRFHDLPQDHRESISLSIPPYSNRGGEEGAEARRSSLADTVDNTSAVIKALQSSLPSSSSSSTSSSSSSSSALITAVSSLPSSESMGVEMVSTQSSSALHGLSNGGDRNANVHDTEGIISDKDILQSEGQLSTTLTNSSPSSPQLSASTPTTPLTYSRSSTPLSKPRTRRPLNILVVDDAIVNLRVLVKMLQPLRANIVTAINGQQAVDYVVERMPIVTDALLPVSPLTPTVLTTVNNTPTTNTRSTTTTTDIHSFRNDRSSDSFPEPHPRAHEHVHEYEGESVNEKEVVVHTMRMDPGNVLMENNSPPSTSTTTVPTHHLPPFDLILTDIMMPVLDGLSLARMIRGIELDRGLPAVPIIALTANAMIQDRQACLDAGIHYFLPKPFNRQTLFTLLNRILGDLPLTTTSLKHLPSSLVHSNSPSHSGQKCVDESSSSSSSLPLPLS